MEYFDNVKCFTYSKDKLNEIKEDSSENMYGLQIIWCVFSYKCEFYLC